jgi:hypothetical protein
MQLSIFWWLHGPLARIRRVIVIVEAWFLWCLFPAAERRLPFETQAFQCLDTGKSNLRSLSFSVQPVVSPLACDPPTLLDVLDVVVKNIAVSVDFAIFGKFAQTVFPGSRDLPLPRPDAFDGRFEVENF